MAAAKGARPHRAAVTRMLRSTGLVHVPEEAPLVELVKALADEMDAGGGARTRADYLSALKDVRRVLGVSAGRPKKSAEASVAKAAEAALSQAGEGSAESDEPVPNDLARFKAKHGIAS